MSQSPISSRHVLEYFARTTGLPLTLLSDAEQLDPQEVQTYFSDRLLGQPDAVAAVTNLITVIKAGLNDPNKPLGSFFFVGPTGVGKTELAKILACYLFGNGDRLLRFDMSEYASGDALARLIGTAWQSQSKDTGELTRRVREQPFSIVLFDEVEKANPVIFDALLGVLGEGRLTNAAGRTTDFRNTIIIMTSNLGASQSQMPSLGFTTESSEKSKDLQAHYVEAAEQFFRPEFFNRIDHLVVFQPLSFEAMGRITRRELDKLLEREGIQKRKLLVEIDDAVIGQLLAQGFHPRYGARPLQREIEKTVIVPLASLLVRKNPTSHQILRFKVRSSRIKIELVPIPTPKPATLPAPNTRQIRALSAILAELAQLQKELLEATDSESLTTLRSTMTRLLAQSYAPTFWDHPTEAQRTLSQIYHLDRVSKRLDDLLERSDRLIQKGESMRLNPPNASFVVKLDQEKDHLGREFAYWTLECAGLAVEPHHDQALLKFVAIGSDSYAWMEQVVHLYMTWADHKGYEYHSLPPTPERRAWGLYLHGSNVFTILQGEAGVHKLNQGDAQHRQRYLVRLQVVPVPETFAKDMAQDEIHQLMLAEVPRAEVAQSDTLARVYTQGRHASVRDPRTGVKISNVRAVLERGEVDEFLLAILQRETTPPS
ncbi:MAG: AAA domain-containing protein [Symploca sp. SIO2B6]|nr:AAA domain-containing protein [Symploca sp. SIO2B6]